MNRLVGFLVSMVWIAGFVIAKGFWPTFFCIIPFWSFYVVVEKLLTILGVI